MKPKFEITINTVRIIHQLPDTWSEADCLRLLQYLEFDGAEALAPSERREYAAMALQDKSEVEAATALIDFLIGQKLNSGRTQNLAEEMTSDRAWEEFADLSMHESIFNAHVMLHLAFPVTPQPEINQIGITLTALDQPATDYLAALANATPPASIPEAVVLRCIAATMPPNAILHRLFEDQINGAPFTEAEFILWQTRGEVLAGSSKPARTISLYSPIRWTTPLEEDWTAECTPFVESLAD